MKASQKDFAQIAPRAAKAARVFFFCGPDEAGAAAAAGQIVALLGDSGERIDLAGADLRRDPVRLGDEARSSSLFGDARHIWVTAAGDEAHDAVANLLASDVEPCPVLIVATGATDKSRTAKLLADRPDALVAMFYPPDLRAITQSVRAMADAAGVGLDDALSSRLARAAGLDIRLAQSEVTKLALYLDAAPERRRIADAATLDAIGASTEDDGFAALVDAVFGGHTTRLSAELARMRELGLSPVGVLLACERRAAQLTQLAAKIGPGGSAARVLDAEKTARRVFWKDVPVLGEQLARWGPARLARLGSRLMALHRAALTNSQDAELLVSQGLAGIARLAARRG